MAIGDITGTIASLEWDTDTVYSLKIIHIAGNIYAIAFWVSGGYGWLKTVSISDDGRTLRNKGSLEWDTEEGHYPDIIHIAGNIYAIAYNGPVDHGYLKTVSISDDGLTLSTVASLEFDTGTRSGYYPDIIHIAGNIYAIAYALLGPIGCGWLKTVSISDDGSTLSTVESLEWDTGEGNYPDIIHIAGDIYAIAYQGSDDCGWLKTVSISDDGLTLSNKGSLEWDTYEGMYPDIIHIAGDIYAIAYQGSEDEGWLKTVGIETTAAAARYRFTGGVGGLQHRAVH